LRFQSRFWARHLHAFFAAGRPFVCDGGHRNDQTPEGGYIMADDIKGKLKEAGDRIAENVGHAADWVKEKTGFGPGRAEGTDAGIEGIRQHMEVFCSCGTKLGIVDRVEDGVIKLTKDNSPDGEHHFIPVSWVSNVDRHVHLTKNSEQAMRDWKSNPQDCVTWGG